MRRFLTFMILILIQAVLLIFFCSCGRPDQSTRMTSHQASPTPGQTETAGQTTHPSPTPSVSPASTTPENSEEQLLEKKSSAPDIDGAEKQIAEINGLRRVIYTALPENPYGFSAGKIVGEYKHEVILGEERTGGVVLAAAVAKAYLHECLDAMPEQQPRWMLILPVDLSDCRSLRPVRIDLSARPLIDRPYYIRVSAEDEQLGVVNILDEQQQVVIDEFKMFGLHYVISHTSNESMSIIAGEEMAFLFVIVRFLSMPRPDADDTFGDRLGTTEEPVLAGLTSVRGPFREHDYDCILKIDGCPVFLMANPVE